MKQKREAHEIRLVLRQVFLDRRHQQQRVQRRVLRGDDGLDHDGFPLVILPTVILSAVGGASIARPRIL